MGSRYLVRSYTAINVLVEILHGYEIDSIRIGSTLKVAVRLILRALIVTSTLGEKEEDCMCC